MSSPGIRAEQRLKAGLDGNIVRVTKLDEFAAKRSIVIQPP
jgi:hypothetical protein